MFKTTKSKIIFVIVFSTICIIITSLAVMYNKIEIETISEEENPVEKVKEKDVLGIDLKGTYNQNDIKIENRKYGSEDVEIEYYQISGLKDKTIEEKINKDLEHVALNDYKNKIQDLSEVKTLSVSMWNSGNFANTLSINVSFFAQKSDETFIEKSESLNYDLTTGNQITIDKLFTSDAPMEDILRNSAYYSLVTRNIEESLQGDLTVKDYGDLEDEIFMFIDLYQKGKITDFYYTPKYIYIPYGENIITIDMQKYPEYIAIYNRYLSDVKIYEINDIGIKKLYTLSDRDKDAYYYQNHQKEDNYYIDITLQLFEENIEDLFPKNLAKQKIEEIEREISIIKQVANENKNNFYILNYGIIINSYNGNVDCIQYGNSYEVTVHDFEETLEPIIVEENRKVPSGELPMYIYNFADILKIEPQTIHETYNSLTGEKIVI